MSGLATILPGMGRGTMRSMGEGILPERCVQRKVPSVSRFASATSPVRGGSI